MALVMKSVKEMIAKCPHCKMDGVSIDPPKFIYQSKTEKCLECKKEYTVEVLVLPQGGIVNASPYVREEQKKVTMLSDFAINVENDIQKEGLKT